MGPDVEDKLGVASHNDKVPLELPPTAGRFRLSAKSRKNDGDVALALFQDVDETREPIDPKEEHKLIRKVDFLILPLIAVNYAFFYIDKTT